MEGDDRINVFGFIGLDPCSALNPAKSPLNLGFSLSIRIVLFMFMWLLRQMLKCFARSGPECSVPCRMDLLMNS